MSQTPDPEVTVSCFMESQEVAETFADAICETLLSEAALRWPNATFTTATNAVSPTHVITFHAVISQDNALKYYLVWGESGDDAPKNRSQEMVMHVSDGALSTINAKGLSARLMNVINFDF